jgi:UbiD family decarboxylase
VVYRDLREFITTLKAMGEVHEVEVQVDKAWEIGAICSENSRKRGPVLIFKKINEFHTPLLVGALGTERRLYAALGVTSSLLAVYEKWFSAMNHRIQPHILRNAPCKEIQLNKINLFDDPFPVPKWHFLDGGPELGTFHSVITRGPKTECVNSGMYRNEILDKNLLGILFSTPNRHAALHWQLWRKKKEPMPVAIAIGLDPYLTILSGSRIPENISEYDVAGGLMGEPYEVVQAETSDLLVPANAEIIIEGEIPTDDFLSHEGPFGEFAGYMGPAQKGTMYIRVKHVTHRKNPIFQGTYEGRFLNESKIIRSYIKSIYVLDYLKKAGIPGIIDVCVTPGGCAGFHTVVSIEKSYPGHARAVIALVLNQPNHFCKYCVVVDEDVDPWDSLQVEWAIATKVQAGRDLVIIKDGSSTTMDPSQVPSRGGWSDLLGIDATSPKDEYEREDAVFPPLADPPQKWITRVRKKWRDYGLD